MFNDLFRLIEEEEKENENRQGQSSLDDEGNEKSMLDVKQ